VQYRSPSTSGSIAKPSTVVAYTNLFISPLGINSPGFEFYIDNPTNWTANFKVSSTPAPLIGSYNFTLWSWDEFN